MISWKKWNLELFLLAVLNEFQFNIHPKRMTAFERNFIKMFRRWKNNVVSVERFFNEIIASGVLWKRVPTVTMTLLNDFEGNVKWFIALFRYWSIKQILYYTIETDLNMDCFVYLYNINVVNSHIFTSDFRKVWKCYLLIKKRNYFRWRKFLFHKICYQMFLFLFLFNSKSKFKWAFSGFSAGWHLGIRLQ